MNSSKPQRLLAVDPSFTCSGWALFGIPDGQVLGVGELRGVAPGPAVAARLRCFLTKVTDLYQALGLSPRDLVVVEAATTMRDPRAAQLVEQVRGIFEVLARAAGAAVPGRLNPRSVQFEVMALRGAQGQRAEVKRAAQTVAETLYGARLRELGVLTGVPGELKRHQDIVDALLVGTLAVSRLRGALASGVSLESVFDMREFRSRRGLGRRAA